MAKDNFNLHEWVGNKERRLLKEDHNSYAEGQEKKLIDLLPGEKVSLDLPMVNEQRDLEDELANEEFGMDFDQLGENEKEWVRDQIQNMKYKNSDEETAQEKLQRTFNDDPNYHDDIDTEGYVENMKQPDLQDAIDAIKEVWEEWKSGPATEANQVPYALEDLLNHIRQELSDFDIK